MGHGIKQCSCGKRISQCRCPGPRGPDGKREPKPVEIIQSGCTSCKHMKKRAPGDAVVLEERQVEQSAFEKFLEKVKEIGVHYETQRYSGWRTEAEKVDPFVSVEWVTGGVSGGSCWGGKADTPRMGDPEPDLEALDKILEAVAPNVTFIQYRQIERACVEKGGERRSDDYYGNYTVYGVKTLDLRKLFDALVERKLIEE